eukprot:TRINITY_DN7299_c0_g1_i2.p1 TRINITY_DN7299_c0_g1~~TRINITY_DN7299_c0_g1_i2.p1  ORF type:complete len:135 (+),score=9.95 TRINITY_DN7299_c0_g1_i2:143-547(+)
MSASDADDTADGGSFDYRASLHLRAKPPDPDDDDCCNEECVDDLDCRRAGYLLLAGCVLVTAGLLYAMVVSKLLPLTGNLFLDSVSHDHYYCFLVPLSILPTILAVYCNWVTLKFFRVHLEHPSLLYILGAMAK